MMDNLIIEDALLAEFAKEIYQDVEKHINNNEVIEKEGEA